MKHKLITWILLLAILMTAFPWAIALASDISGALFFATIRISNNSTLTNYVQTTCNLSSPNLMAGSYMNTDANNIALLDASDNDVPFMPGYDTNPWCFMVETIGEDSYINYELYTAESTGGSIAYFPASGGMTVSDNATIELGNTFEVNAYGFVDTTVSGVNQSIFIKSEAIQAYISATDDITARFIDTVNTNWVVPTSHNDPDAEWANEAQAYDGNTATFASNPNIPFCGGYGGFLEFSIAATYADRIRYYAWLENNTQAAGDSIDVDVYYDGGWNDLYDGTFLDDTWETKTFGSVKEVTQVRIRFDESGCGGIDKEARIKEINIGNTPWVTVTASGITRGEHVVKVTGDAVDFKIYVDAVEEDSIALAGASVVDNANDWDFFIDNTMPYIYTANISVSGTAISSWEWEYDTTFYDSIGVNDATPTFRTSSSDADVSAEVIEFQPVSEAKAPAWSLSEEVATWVTAPNITGNFTTVVAPTLPGSDVIEDISNATGTPTQLPWTTMAGFLILAISFTLSWKLKESGARSLMVKWMVIALFMGILVVLGIFDFWMLIFFVLMALAVNSMSKPGEVV